jgi:Na+-driven multidrug efflux pump
MQLSRPLYFLTTYGLILVILETPAFAYLGPGLGMGALGVAFGILGSIFFGFVAVIWYPIKRLLRSVRRNNKESDPKDNAEN